MFTLLTRITFYLLMIAKLIIYVVGCLNIFRNFKMVPNHLLNLRSSSQLSQYKSSQAFDWLIQSHVS